MKPTSMTKTIKPMLFSMPVVENLDLPSRAEMLPGIESGEIDHIDFTARTYGTGRNHNPYLFKDSDLPAFAKSFEGKPFLRNHDTYDIDSRDGQIMGSKNVNGVFEQIVRLTTRRGMTDFLEGKIDRFSIGWTYDDAICTICNSSFFSTSCAHWPGRTYQTADGPKVCQLLFVNPKGRETSAVNDPAVEGTEVIEANLEAQYVESFNQALCESKLDPTENILAYGLMTKEEVISKDEGITAGEQAGDDHTAGSAEEVEGEVKAQDESEGQVPSDNEPGEEPSAEVEQSAMVPDLAAQARRRNWELERAEKDFFPEGDLNIMNLREKMNERAQLIQRARELANLADKEGRAFTDAEKAEYEAIMGAGETQGKVDVLAGEIKGELETRNKLNEAEKSLAELATEAVKPDGKKASLTRAEFEALNNHAKAEYMKTVGKLTD